MLPSKNLRQFNAKEILLIKQLNDKFMLMKNISVNFKELLKVLRWLVRNEVKMFYTRNSNPLTTIRLGLRLRFILVKPHIKRKFTPISVLCFWTDLKLKFNFHRILYLFNHRIIQNQYLKFNVKRHQIKLTPLNRLKITSFQSLR